MCPCRALFRLLPVILLGAAIFPDMAQAADAWTAMGTGAAEQGVAGQALAVLAADWMRQILAAGVSPGLRLLADWSGPAPRPPSPQGLIWIGALAGIVPRR